jgi:hypothetical protein
MTGEIRLKDCDTDQQLGRHLGGLPDVCNLAKGSPIARRTNTSAKMDKRA